MNRAFQREWDRLPSENADLGLPSFAKSLHCEWMSDAVDDEVSVEKKGCQLAAAIELAFIDADWPTGELFGIEEQLCELYGVSHRTYKEAVRILTMRGTVQVRRGAHSGLVIAAPDPAVIADVMCGYAYLVGINERHCADMRIFMARTRERLEQSDAGASQSVVLSFLSSFIDNTFNPGMPPKGLLRSKFRRNRAGQIALRVLEDHVWTLTKPGMRVASEQQLSEQYCADRSIARQAIRMLESSGIITSIPGRGKGLYTQRPPVGPVCRLLCCFFASNKVPKSLSCKLFEAMSIEVMALAAQSADTVTLQRSQDYVEKFKLAEQVTIKDMLAIEDSIGAMLDNPFINLILKSVRGYVAPMIARESRPIAREVSQYCLTSSQRVLDAIRSRDPAAAALAQLERLSHMRELERLHFT